MKTSERESYYWRSEYEAIRRRLIDEMKKQRQLHHNFVIATWSLLKALGMNEKEIIEYYAKQV